MEYIKEKDLLGTVLIPEGVYYGTQTQRSLDAFPVSGMVFPPIFIHSLALIKKCAALTNGALGILKHKISDAIVVAAQEVIDGQFDDQFVLDVFQIGSGASTNMNMNEVIAARANEIITGVKVGKFPVHPDDHVNAGQSSSNVIPSALNITVITAITDNLLPALSIFYEKLNQKAEEFADIKKIGRTHLQDSRPITLGQEFSAYARQIEIGIDRIKTVKNRLLELPLGETVLEAGSDKHPDFAKKIILSIIDITNLPFRLAKNYLEAQSSHDSAVDASSALKTISVSLYKIANDIRWMASGPHCGISEINLPQILPDNSIIPQTINPAVPEVAMQAAIQIIGNDTTIALCGKAGNFELNSMLPLIIHNLLQSLTILSGTIQIFSQKCIAGITANKHKCRSYMENSLSLATLLVPYIGYDQAADIAREAAHTGETIRHIVLKRKILPPNDLDTLLQ